MKTALILGVLLLAACSDASSTASVASTTLPAQPDANDVVLSADLIGGCFMMGPNCSRYVVYGDGRVEGFRLGADESELVEETTVDASVVAELYAEAAATDLKALRARLPVGECRACVDGVDTVIILNVDGAETVFDSAQVEFDSAEPVFAAVNQLIAEAASGIEIPTLSR